MVQLKEYLNIYHTKNNNLYFKKKKQFNRFQFPKFNFFMFVN